MVPLVSSGRSVHMHTHAGEWYTWYLLAALYICTHMQASTHMKIHTHLHKQSHTKNATVSSTAQNDIENV